MLELGWVRRLVHFSHRICAEPDNDAIPGDIMPTVFTNTSCLRIRLGEGGQVALSTSVMNDISSPTARLAELRSQLDALDDQIHDLLMRRAKVVQTVAAEGGKKGTKIRPGREAIILRRLLARHQGAWPAQAIIRIWQEIFSAALTIEGGQTMAVCGGEDAEARLGLAREYFGPLTPVRRHHSPAQTLSDLTRKGGSQLAILPPLREGDDVHGGWWTMLASTDPALYVIMKLPFWKPRAEGLSNCEAFVVATIPPDASGADHGLILLGFQAETSRARIIERMAAAGFTPQALWVRRQGEGQVLLALVEVVGLVEAKDPRLALITGLAMPPRVVGGYALPITKGPQE